MRRPLTMQRRARPVEPRRTRDVETRQRLLDSALRLFAEHGFFKASVRDICQDASANLAAVNYHFGDKTGLYMAVVRLALTAVQDVNDVTMRAREGSPPEEKLRHYVRTYLPRLLKPEGRASWIQKLLRHEMTEPTIAAHFITEQMILPRLRYLATLIAEMLDCPADDHRVRLCVESLQAQCLFYTPNPFRDTAFAAWRPKTPAEIAAVAAHIADFSIAGILARRS